jgi:hypothetical protein
MSAKGGKNAKVSLICAPTARGVRRGLFARFTLRHLFWCELCNGGGKGWSKGCWVTELGSRRHAESGAAASDGRAVKRDWWVRTWVRTQLAHLFAWCHPPPILVWAVVPPLFHSHTTCILHCPHTYSFFQWEGVGLSRSCVTPLLISIHTSSVPSASDPPVPATR